MKEAKIKKQKWISKSPAETEAIAAKLASKLRGGEVLLLEGELGAGKTTFVRGLARALGVRGPIRSPTFTLLHEYKLKPKTSPPRADLRPRRMRLGSTPRAENLKYLIHVDAYRLKFAADLRAIGLEEYLGDEDTVVAIEWGREARSFICKKCWTVRLKHAGAGTRIIYVSR